MSALGQKQTYAVQKRMSTFTGRVEMILSTSAVESVALKRRTVASAPRCDSHSRCIRVTLSRGFHRSVRCSPCRNAGVENGAQNERTIEKLVEAPWWLCQPFLSRSATI